MLTGRRQPCGSGLPAAMVVEADSMWGIAPDRALPPSDRRSLKAGRVALSLWERPAGRESGRAKITACTSTSSAFQVPSIIFSPHHAPAGALRSAPASRADEPTPRCFTMVIASVIETSSRRTLLAGMYITLPDIGVGA